MPVAWSINPQFRCAMASNRLPKVGVARAVAVPDDQSSLIP